MFRRRYVALVGLVLAALAPVLASTSSWSEPSLTISDATVSEDQREVTLTVTRTAVDLWTYTNFEVRSGTAQAEADFAPTYAHVGFNPGETTKTVVVPIVSDAVSEGPETFTAFLYGTNNVPIGRGEATVTITDPSSPSEPSLSISDATVREDERAVTITVTRTAVDLWTHTNFDVRPGTAQENTDYVRTSVSFGFNPGETTKTFTVPIVSDNVSEGPETFTAFLYGTNNVAIGRGEATVTITEGGATDPNTNEPAPIASNFDRLPLLVPSWGTGAIAPSNGDDVVGAFRFICNPSHLSYDDPIVYPGQPGRAHLHQFFGNTQANANSTYESLRTSGDSTCNNALNRSAYWLPAMMNGRGQVVRPDYISIYYKRRPASDPKCTLGNPGAVGDCVDLPRGLRFVFGYDMLRNEQPTNGYFDCDGPGAVSRHYANIVEAAKGCPPGARLGAIIAAPGCWDGKNLDSPNHRDHVAYASDGGFGVCPASHPKVIPTFTMGAWYTVDDTLERTGGVSWHLSSDVMPGMPMMTPGSTFHADWFGAWDDEVMQMWTAHCINRKLNCSGGDLGNGWQLRNFDGFRWHAEPRLVPVPPAP
jgi:hypothetical protein